MHKAAEILRGQIERGELVPRQPLPSESYLVGEYGISRGTARKAIAMLRDEGLVRTIPQRGTYVIRACATTVTKRAFPVPACPGQARPVG